MCPCHTGNKIVLGLRWSINHQQEAIFYAPIPVFFMNEILLTLMSARVNFM